MPFREKLANRAKTAGITLKTPLRSALEAYFSLLRKWNLKISLTSLDVETPSDEAIDRLLIEPLLAAEQLPSDSRLWVDIGSGGGSPAIPLKLVRPSIPLHMVESKVRKAAFLREAVRQLALADTYVQNVRTEQLARDPAFSATVDVLTIRAVKLDAPVLMDIDRFLRPHGVALLFQSATATADVMAPLIAERDIPLIASLGTRLLVLRKPIGPESLISGCST